MSRPYRKGNAPKYRNKITKIEKLPVALRVVLRRLWLAKINKVPVRVQTACATQEIAQAWVAVWSTMEIHVKREGQFVAVIELNKDEIVSAKLMDVEQVKTITRTKQEQALLDAMDTHKIPPLMARMSRSAE